MLPSYCIFSQKRVIRVYHDYNLKDCVAGGHSCLACSSSQPNIESDLLGTFQSSLISWLFMLRFWFPVIIGLIMCPRIWIHVP